MNMNTMPLEADTRLLIDRSLENLGWKFDGAERNVFFEQPKKETERKKLGGKRPDYVLYSGEQPLIVIEAKRPGARIDNALEQGIGYAKALEAPLVFATDGVFCKAFHTGANRPPILNGDEIDEFIREALALRYLSTYEVNTISPKVQYDRKELIRIFDEANNMLRGDGLRAGIERFGEFANILFLKLISVLASMKNIHRCMDQPIRKWCEQILLSYCAEEGEYGAYTNPVDFITEQMIQSFKLSINELLICNEMSVSHIITKHRGYSKKLKEYKTAIATYCTDMGYILSK